MMSAPANMSCNNNVTFCAVELHERDELEKRERAACVEKADADDGGRWTRVQCKTFIGLECLLVIMERKKLQGSAKRWSPGLVNSFAAVAFHFCLALLAAFSQCGPPFSRAL